MAVREIKIKFTNDYITALKHTTSSTSFIISKEIDPEAMPPVPDNPKSWEDHLLQVCRTRLSLALAEEKKKFEADISKESESLGHKMIGQLEALHDLLSNRDLPPIKDPPPVKASLRFLREEISQVIKEKSH